MDKYMIEQDIKCPKQCICSILNWNMSMHRLTHPLGQRLFQMQFLVAKATFAYSTCQASIENWAMWSLSAHHLGLLSGSGGDLMLSAAAGVHSSFVQEKDTLLRRSWPRWKERQSQILTREEETDLPHRLRNSSGSWHHLDSTTFLLLHSVSGSASSSE